MFKKIALSTLAVSLMASAAPAYAQSVSTDVQSGVNAETSGMQSNSGLKTNMKANAASDITLGSVVSDIRKGEPVALDQIDANAEVEIVEVAELQGQGAENSAAIEGALKANSSVIDQLHASIEADARLKQELEANGFDTDDVVAANTKIDGTLILYVWDRA